jgi:hypothetical protein
MAPTNRIRVDGLLCATAPPTLGAAITNPTGTGITFPGALKHSGAVAVPTIADPDYLPLVIDPDTNVLEIVWLTAYTAGSTTGTILRAQEGSTGAAHIIDAPVVHGPTVSDLPPTPGDHYIRRRNSASPVALAVGAGGAIGVLLDTVEADADWASYDPVTQAVTLTEDDNYTIEVDAYATWVTPPTSGFVDVSASTTYGLDPFMIGYLSWDIASAGYDPVVIKRSFYPAGTIISPYFENNTDQAASVEFARLYILRG